MLEAVFQRFVRVGFGAFGVLGLGFELCRGGRRGRASGFRVLG